MKEYGTSIVDLLNFELTEEEARDFYREDGYESGVKAGIKEGKISTAQNMLLKGMDVGIVCDCTGLPAETVEELLSKLNEEQSNLE